MSQLVLSPDTVLDGAQVLEGGRTFFGRIGPARREVLRLLSLELQGGIDELCAREGRAPIQIKSFRFARPVLTGIIFPAILVDATINVEEIAPRVVKYVPSIEISLVGGRLEDIEADEDYLDAIEVAALVMKHRQAGHCLPAQAGALAGKRAWNVLSYASIGPLRESWSDYAGHTLSLRVDQAGCSLWPLPPLPPSAGQTTV